MNNQQFFIESLGIGLLNYESMNNLDLEKDEYLVVGQRSSENNAKGKDIKYNFIVNNNGVGINATRNQIPPRACLYIPDDIICGGRVITNGIEIAGVGIASDINTSMLYQILNASSSNNIFYQGCNIIKVDNKYTTSFLTLGSIGATYSNIHPLNIVNSGNNTIQNNHISIQNDIDNIYDEPCKLTFGIIGNNQESPAVITTTSNMALEFHISKESNDINKLYIGVNEKIKNKIINKKGKSS